MSWTYVGIGVIILIAVLLIIFRKNPYVRRYWGYSLILAPISVLLILKIIADLKNIRGTGTTPAQVGLQDRIDALEDDISEVQMDSAVEIAAAKKKNEETLKKLEEVRKIEDKSERRKKLAELLG